MYREDEIKKSKYPDPEIDQKQLDQLDKIINGNYKNSNEKQSKNSEKLSNKNYISEVSRDKDSNRINSYRDQERNYY